MTGTDVRDWMRERWRDPVFWSGVTQIVKTALAAVIAWVIVTELLDLPQSFLAPWAALLVVHSTVYRTFSQGVRQVAAAVLGVVLAWAVGSALGIDPTAVAIVLLLGLALGSAPWFGDEATTVAATALIVLTTGVSDQDNILLLRLADTGIGIAVGLFVNVLVWPPLRRRSAIAAMGALDDRIGELLIDVGEGLERGYSRDDVDEWLDRTRELDEELDRAWALVRQASQSARMNPRRSATELRDPREWVSLLEHVEQALADTRSMARTLSHAQAHLGTWQSGFRTALADAAAGGGPGHRPGRPGPDPSVSGTARRPGRPRGRRRDDAAYVACVRRAPGQPAQRSRRDGRGGRRQPDEPATPAVHEALTVTSGGQSRSGGLAVTGPSSATASLTASSRVRRPGAAVRGSG